MRPGERIRDAGGLLACLVLIALLGYVIHGMAAIAEVLP